MQSKCRCGRCSCVGTLRLAKRDARTLASCIASQRLRSSRQKAQWGKAAERGTVDVQAAIRFQRCSGLGRAAG